jgi:hypothetical protein
VVPLEESIERTLDFFLREHLDSADSGAAAEPAASRARPAAPVGVRSGG